MIPTMLTNLALGIQALTAAGAVTLASILTSAAWVTGSVIFPGNIFLLPDANTTTANSVYVGTQQAMKITASGLDFITNGSQSGTSLMTDGRVSLHDRWVTCSQTGGLAKYPTCLVNSPFSTTGALVYVSLECGNTYKNLSMSGGFVKSSTAAVGTAFRNLQTVTASTGANLAFSTGVYIWNSADKIKFQTVTTLPSSSIDCKVHYQAYDKYGN